MVKAVFLSSILYLKATLCTGVAVCAKYRVEPYTLRIYKDTEITSCYPIGQNFDRKDNSNCLNPRKINFIECMV